jgi:hypothetical protein
MGRWGGRDSPHCRAMDTWSPEAREAAAAARKGHKFGLTASHPSGSGQKFASKANSHEEVEKHMGSLRKSFPEHNVTVQNNHHGMVHTFKPTEKYDRNLTE